MITRLCCFLSFWVAAAAADGTVLIAADLTESYRHVYHAEIDLPAHEGVNRFTSPLWVPGSHAPNGPIGNITGVVFSARGQTLRWKRDELNLAEFQVSVPAGVSSVHVHLDALMPSRATRHIAVLEWESVLLYPAHVPVSDIRVRASVIVPAGWGIGTALQSATKRNSVTTSYAITTVEQLEDSPVLAGEYFHEYRLAEKMPVPHFLDIAGDEPGDAVLRPEVLEAMERLIHEAEAEFGGFHYNRFHFLITRSDYAGGNGGIEHGQSTDIGIRKSSLTDEAHQLADADLLAHEFAHSWNGKYRRPAGLYKADFATPVQSRLLWIYEGLTQYLGDVLATRAGLKTPQQFREMLALVAADLEYQPGRAWRSTEDTAVAVSLLRGNGAGWVNWRRGKAYYAEGELLWLDVDTLIRQLTSNRKSLDDFAKAFLGNGASTGPQIVPYTLDDVVVGLNRVAAYDWARFFEDRVAAIQPHADLQGIERGGYRLTYTESPSLAEQILTDPESSLYVGDDFWYSIGLRIDRDGGLMDVRWGGPADQAKLVPKGKLIRVNGEPYTVAALRGAIARAKTDPAPIRLTFRQEGETISAEVDYHGGERFPALVRSSDSLALLDLIINDHASLR